MSFNCVGIDLTHSISIGLSDWSTPGAHVRFDEVDPAVPLTLIVSLEQDEGIRVLL